MNDLRIAIQILALSASFVNYLIAMKLALWDGDRIKAAYPLAMAALLMATYPVL